MPHLDPQSCLEPGGRQPSEERLRAGEEHGPGSRCVETDGSRSYSLCLRTECNVASGRDVILKHLLTHDRTFISLFLMIYYCLDKMVESS